MSQFLKTKTEKTAKSVNEAVEEALKELEITEEEAEIKIIDEGSKGFLGLGAKEAVVEVSVKNEEMFRAKGFLSSIFDAMDMEVAIEAGETEEGLSINLEGDHMGILIGKRGDTLDSLQYLTSLVVNRTRDDYKKVTIDTENYREKRADALLALANRLANKVTKSGKKYTLEPMNPYERRIIHATLQDHEGVTTFSIGEEPYRKVVIAPKVEKPQYKKNRGDRPAKRFPKKSASEKTYATGGGYEPKKTYKRPANPYPRPVNKNKASSFEAYLAEHGYNDPVIAVDSSTDDSVQD